MGSSTDIINIEAKAQRIAVDNRISLRFYFRIANNVLKQAAIFRAENNLIDLYVMLLRFSSLALETIPSHRDYRTSPKYDKEYLRMRSLDVLTELEKLKPAVRRILIDLKAKHTRQAFQSHQHGTDLSVRHGIRKPMLTNYNTPKVAKPAGLELGYQSSRSQKFLRAGPVEDQFRNLSANFVRPSLETLSKHCILGPNGLNGQWQPPKTDRKVQYPSNIDLTPVEIPSFRNYFENEVTAKQDNCISAPENPVVDSGTALEGVGKRNQAEEPASLISFEESESIAVNNIIRQPSPPPVRAEVQDLIPAACLEVSEVECKIENSLSDVSLQSESPLQLHISTTMMDTFMRLAKSNTSKNLETCGVLAGSLKDRKFYITALIVPKQEATSDSCQATNEEEIFEVQDKRSLFQLGWIHTHPTQSCFMSSIDLHTHYSYQIMLPESVAIVMAPKDSSRNHGIFRLTTPGGMSVIRQCEQRGFHPHNPPSDGGPIYKTCTDVYMNPNLKFDVIDLR